MEKQAFNVTTNSRGAKKYPKTARRLRGNTLVPVVIALAISAVATVAFLQQGETLMEDNKRILATTEVARLVSNIQQLIAIGTAPGQIAQSTIGIAGDKNVFGSGITYGDSKLVYPTGSVAVCALLKGTFDAKRKNIVSSTCAKEGQETTDDILKITFGE